ncbi:metallophosphoesterase [Pararobbsia silviterrae]|uniref:Metallophosphoesterase n=1 Tax=Pararobbsia silviterrae TaxID=1792498 RepID=A0A494Y5A3_9BURK|nr:metallophosphoesterase [Pararobbsia silviterrae]RKP57879.1 metallophosphoesterase [Pararobbsia silviterrae]
MYRPVRRLPANRRGRDFIIGDLHGHTGALRHLLRDVAFDPAEDRLLSVGDLVDRGDHSAQAIGLLDMPWFHSVRGNHEDMLIAVVDGLLDFEGWAKVGGEWAREVPREILAGYAERLRVLPLALIVGSEHERFNIVHAEFFGDDRALDVGHFSDHVRQRLLWGRQLVGGTAPGTAAALHAGLSTTYCGHTPVERVTRIGAQVFIDTGVFTRTGELTIVEHATGVTRSIAPAQAAAAGADDWPWPAADQASASAMRTHSGN